MARPGRPDPIPVAVGTTWTPKWGKPHTPLRVVARVERPSGLCFVVEYLAPRKPRACRQNLISYKQLLDKYKLTSGCD